MLPDPTGGRSQGAWPAGRVTRRARTGGIPPTTGARALWRAGQGCVLGWPLPLTRPQGPEPSRAVWVGPLWRDRPCPPPEPSPGPASALNHGSAGPGMSVTQPCPPTDLWHTPAGGWPVPGCFCGATGDTGGGATIPPCPTPCTSTYTDGPCPPPRAPGTCVLPAPPTRTEWPGLPLEVGGRDEPALPPLTPRAPRPRRHASD